MERSLIVERVMAGLRNAKAKGKKLGRPHVFVDARRIANMRNAGQSWPQIATELGLGVGTVYRAYQRLSRNPAPKMLAAD